MKLTAKQKQAQILMAGEATNLMLWGGGRSGKSVVILRQILVRAIKAPGSRHVVFRFRYNHVRSSIMLETFPKVMASCFPGLTYDWKDDGSYALLPNGSEVWLAGLDDKLRTEKILGKEFASIYFNECSQIPWSSVQLAITRLAQLVFQALPGKEPKLLKPRLYFDCNPPNKAHWSYKLFISKKDPETKLDLKDQNDYASMQMNPKDNAANISPQYIKTLEGMSSRMRKRFLEGEFADATPNQLFQEAWFDQYRVTDGIVPEYVRVVVAVDPSGSGDIDNADNDEIGIVVCGLGIDGNAYVIEDLTCKVGPATWGGIATSAYDRHDADMIVAEVNYGGSMVRHVIQTARARTPFKQVTATRGKHIRAEPFSALYETGKVRHVGDFSPLEDELVAFSTVGWTGEGSPNRADALIWCLAELFPGLLKKAERVEEVQQQREITVRSRPDRGSGGTNWMR